MKIHIHLNDLFVRDVNVLTTDLDGEIGLIHIETGKYYFFEQASSRIWSFLESPISVKDIIYKLMEEYEVDESICSEQTLAFLSSLRDLNLVHLVETTTNIHTSYNHQGRETKLTNSRN